MRVTLKLTTDNQTVETVRLGSQLAEKTKEAVAGLNDGRISYDDARDLIVTAAASGFQGGALSTDELKFLEFLAGPGASKQIRLVGTGEELQVRVTQGKRSGAAALAHGSAPWNAAKALILKGVEDRAWAEFGREQGEAFKVTAHPVQVDSPQALEAMLNELVSTEAKALNYRRPVVYEPVRVFQDTTMPFAGALATSSSVRLAWAPKPTRDDRPTFPGSQTEAQLARAIKVLGGDDWKITNYSVTDGDETGEVGAVIYSAEMGLAVRFGYWSRN